MSAYLEINAKQNKENACIITYFCLYIYIYTIGITFIIGK